MKRNARSQSFSVAAGLVGLLAAALSAPAAAAPETTYTSVEWAHLPDGQKWGTMSAVAIDSKGTVYTFQRENAEKGEPSRVIVFDKSGKFLRTWGETMFPLAHGLRVDRQDNIWVTDLRLHQVIKFNPEGKVLLELGKKGIQGDNSSTDLLNGPSDLVIAPSGDIFVADGESTSTRVVKFSAEGKLIKFWGTKGAGPGEMNVPHSIGMDSQGRVYVADRSNNRIQIFDQDGKYLDEMTNVGTPYGLFVKDDVIYVVDGKNNNLTLYGTKDKVKVAVIEGLNTPHMVSVDERGAIYVAEQGVQGPGPAVRKFIGK